MFVPRTTSSRYRRAILKYLPTLVIGILAGYIAGTRNLTLQEISQIKYELSQPTPQPAEQEILDQYHPHGQKPVKAALVALVRNTDLLGMRQTIRQIEDRFNSRFNYPYIFLNDVPFTEEFKAGVRILTSANVSFGELDSESWGMPEWIDRERFEVVKRTARYPHGGSDSYRKMCRFQSGFIHKHPLLADLEFYWRIEPDNGLKYGWVIGMTEFMDTVATLWNTTMGFIAEHPGMVSPANLKRWLLDDAGNYNGCHFWTNFEIVDLSFYRSPRHLDRAGGFFYERWGDAPVHSIAAALFLNASQTHWFEDIGYFHPAVAKCPSGSKHSQQRSFVEKSYCIVRYKESKQMVLDPEATEPVHTGPVYMAVPVVG
ncbi:glycosyl transferase [Linderina pennispora]|uniref:Glycosyl transferase n=1 Tax=Linderina pennispora TaxID=61395 RepID=A0A1Y1VQT5_9FUNG|nr:glycosyl transferase [Linderina pennispora]ORX63638.1 glycosyl transferase [Linderina pennispora]